MDNKEADQAICDIVQSVVKAFNGELYALTWKLTKQEYEGTENAAQDTLIYLAGVALNRLTGKFKRWWTEEETFFLE